MKKNLILLKLTRISFFSIFQWDEALLTMSKGEKANLEIESEWAYGKKGQPDAKYPADIYHYVDCKTIFPIQ